MHYLLNLGNLPNKELPLVSLSNPAPTKQKINERKMIVSRLADLMGLVS